ncbi:unnamed protein product [Rotaria socialis]|uniref:Peptidase C1A papain C-terminal domain-containing protein n=1 Tax=Rotaria socialis TaxID=392032 RepID=A0A821ABC9_9BILA|nr:unnamed protein product [Rotaria socialis]CAF3402158.1 unnamed protein product [Rotaria socialis]CAF3713708.1 unnamed protein product [Rotaria socialis]CAF3719776.1 unnamed protein product [Rotaria socialis]CAF4334618.1 unnamed protein product [Rotaria socialis]
MPIHTYLINRFTDKICRLNGIKESHRMPHKEELKMAFSDHVLLTQDQLPPKVDLRPFMSTVEDQSRIGSCTANALAGAYEYLIKKNHGTNIDVSRLFIYYNGRVKNTHLPVVTDSGCSMTNAIEALAEFGTCLELTWPYAIASVNSIPNVRAFHQGLKHKIRQALHVKIDLNEMKSCLAQGFPFAFGLRLYVSFDQAAKTGIVPMPNQEEQSRAEHGRHALLAVGYSDQSKAFIVRNSWGENWGDKGYCYIPYDYITNPKLCFDPWVIRQFGNDDMGNDHWHFLDTFDFLFKAESDTNYDHIEVKEMHEQDAHA